MFQSEEEIQRKAGLAAYNLYKQQGQPTSPNTSVPGAGIELAPQPESVPDYLLPFDTLMARANAGNASAQFLVGRALLTGCMGQKKNENEANHWLQKARNNQGKQSADPAQTAAVLCAEGVCNARAVGGLKIIDKKAAKECFRAAIALGDIPSRFELAVILLNESFHTTTSTVEYRGNILEKNDYQKSERRSKTSGSNYVASTCS